MLSLSPPAGDAVGPRLRPPRFAAATRISILLTAWACLSATVAAQTLPYVPTSIFLPAPKPGPTGDNGTRELAYIFSPQESSVDLLSLDISGTLLASSLSLTTLSSGLPFLEKDGTAFMPSLADNGSLLVIWSFDPSTPGNESTRWSQGDIGLAAGAESISMGPGFLGASFSFSTMLEPETSPTSTFVYGGMCPNHDSDAASSQSRAIYSNQMVKISIAGSNSYTVEPVQSSGPPVPEAGFTFTHLAPSFSNRSGIITQQINYVLLGGHTQYAFINMSTVAIWSLPQESWSFVSGIFTAASGSSSTVESVDSRSGHTAVLNEDGTSLIIYGGWVGDLTQAAFPQLAVLQIGSDYGGDGEWQWSIPESQPPGDGIYGHGAALLPGNVMMIYGGHTISPSGGNKRRQTGGSTASFLNLTSMTWSDGYTNPSYTGSSAAGSTPSMGSSQKGKLGLVVAILAYKLYRKRRRNRRTIRDSTLRALAQDNSRFLGHVDLAGEYDQGNNWYMGGPDPYSLKTGRTSLDNGRHDWFGDMASVSSMSQVNRKPVAPRAARGQHQPTSSAGYEQVSAQRGLGGMNPIFEADEDGSGDIGEEAISPVRDGRRDSAAYSDPFSTPTRERPISFPPPARGSQTPSPEDRTRASVTDPDVQDWMTDVDAADALLTGGGRTSPSRRGFGVTTEEDGSRTESNISESNRSNLSRSGSLLRQFRPGFGVAGRGGSSSSSSAPSYNTARSFPALQAEGPGLLLGREREGEDPEDEPQEPGSPSKNKPRRSWLGSLRRVFTGPEPSPTGDMDEDAPFQDDVVEANDIGARRGSLSGISGLAADGLLRRKGGRGAWESNDAGSSQGATRYAPLHGTRGEGEHPDDEEWDIEKAVEKRLVQVMFTVPREPLRVVNAEPDFDSERDIVVLDPTQDEDRRDSEGQQQMPEKQRGLVMPMTGELETPLRPISTPSPLDDEDKQRTAGSSAEKEALRRELDTEWELIGAKEAVPEAPRTPEPLQPRTPPQTHSQPRSSLGSNIPRRSPLSHRHQHTPRAGPELAPLTFEEHINRVGNELHQSRTAAQTPISIMSHHSDADVLSAQAIRFERPRVRAMVEEFESKSSREASPAGSPVKESPTRGTPTRGSPTRGR
ncbi:hypothetical protein F4823DRAFT_627951 [Ustulina deusta]|nr:hypothetical protein F4823DRAFT_627951 [Ustulina deusta]